MLNSRRAFLVVIGLLLLASWSNRFVTDEDYVTFQCARNLIQGHGLYWSPAQRTDGGASFTWTLLMAAGVRLGFEPVGFSVFISMVCLTGVLLATWSLSLRIVGSNGQALLVLLILGANYTFSAWATGGQETILVTLVAVAALWAAGDLIESGRPANLWRLACVSILLAFGVLVRIEAIVILGLAGLAIMNWIWRRSSSRGERARGLLCLCAPFLLISISWLAWGQAYYEAPAFRAVHSLNDGFYYVYSFLLSYWLIWLPFLIVPAVPRLFAGRPTLRIVAVACGLWMMFLILEGGDWMEYRRMVPALPLISILIVWVLFHYVDQRTVRHALLLLTFVGSLHHALTFHGTGGVEQSGIESIPELAEAERTSANIGRQLGRLFSGKPVVIATTSVGAIAYNSRLETIGMRGLSINELKARGVHLVLGRPKLVRRGQSPKNAARSGRDVVYIPIDDKFDLEAIYLTPNPAIDQALQAK